jgi:hypothetical protein
VAGLAKSLGGRYALPRDAAMTIDEVGHLWSKTGDSAAFSSAQHFLQRQWLPTTSPAN